MMGAVNLVINFILKLFLGFLQEKKKPPPTHFARVMMAIDHIPRTCYQADYYGYILVSSNRQGKKEKE